MKIGDLFVALGVKVDQEKLNRFNRSLNNIRRDILLVGTAFVGAGVAIDRFVNGTVQGVVALQNLNNQTGLAIDELQKLQQAGQLADLTLTPEAISQSVANLQRNLANISLGQGNIRPFQLLGIDPRTTDAFKVIDQLRDSIKGLDPAIATNLIQELGLSPQFINILKLSRREFEQLSQNTFLGSRQRDLVLQAGTAFTRLRLNMKALKDQAVAKLAPLLIDITERFFKWTKDNGKKVSDAISSIVRAMTLFVTAIARVTNLIGEFIEKLFGVENGIKIIAIALAALGIILIPFKRIFAIGGAILLLLDDIAAWAKGGKSLFGELFDSIASFFGKLRDVFSEIKEFITDTVLFKAIETLTKAFGKGQELDISTTTNNQDTGLFDKFAGDLGQLFGFGAGVLQNLIPSTNTSTVNNVNITNNIDGAQDARISAEEVIGTANAQFNNGGL